MEQEKESLLWRKTGNFQWVDIWHCNPLAHLFVSVLRPVPQISSQSTEPVRPEKYQHVNDFPCVFYSAMRPFSQISSHSLGIHSCPCCLRFQIPKHHTFLLLFTLSKPTAKCSNIFDEGSCGRAPMCFQQCTYGHEAFLPPPNKYSPSSSAKYRRVKFLTDLNSLMQRVVTMDWIVGTS